MHLYDKRLQHKALIVQTSRWFCGVFLIMVYFLLSYLWKCICYWPEDGRPYVALGKVLSKQSKTSQAREVYEKGCQATQGENSFIWQVSIQFYFCM
jgi:NADH:ubiquinone oxidoreductase subunit 3 (subunit A)